MWTFTSLALTTPHQWHGVIIRAGTINQLIDNRNQFWWIFAYRLHFLKINYRLSSSPKTQQLAAWTLYLLYSIVLYYVSVTICTHHHALCVIHASSYYTTEEDNWLVVKTFSINKYKEIDWWNTNKNELYRTQSFRTLQQGKWL